MNRSSNRYADNDTSFERFEKPSRTSRTAAHAKLDRATESKISALENQVERLSLANLSLSNLARRILHFVPAHLRGIYETQMESIKSGQFTDGA